MPMVAGDGKPVSVKLAAAAGLTTMSPSLPQSLGVWESVAVINWGPAVLKVALNWPTPLVKVTLAGNMALVSLLVMVTGSLKLVFTVPSAFRAVMVKVSATPAMGLVEPALRARLGPVGTIHSSLPYVPSLAVNSSVPLRLVKLLGYAPLGSVALRVSTPPK